VYRVFYDSVLRHLPPEAAHRGAFWLIRAAAQVPGAAWAGQKALGSRDPVLRVRAFGLDFPGPLGLAAGFDKDGEGVLGLAALGFSFIEVGTVTARPQPGNPRPRMFRFPDERALVNRMGFNNHGAYALSARLRALRAQWGAQPGAKPVIGVNIGKSKAVPEENAVADYKASARVVADVADYVVVNVSSPNTPGLRDLQAVGKLRPIMIGVRDALDEGSPRRRVPLLVKIAPDLADEDIDAIADMALDLGLDGIIATNTTISRDGLADSAAVADAGPGGMSGAPLKQRSLAVLARLHDRTGKRLVLIAAGGIETAADAEARLAAGATLLQAYTAFIYQGPFWPHRVQRDLAARLRSGKMTSLLGPDGLAWDNSGMSEISSSNLSAVAVYCGSNLGSEPAYAAGAAALGRVLAERGIRLVWGGGQVGLMGSVADAVLGSGGQAFGVITQALKAKEVAYQGLAELQVVATMHERKAVMADAADAFVMLPGGFGTLDEFFEVVTWTQLGIHAKPCGILDVGGYFGALRTMLDAAVTAGFVRQAHRDMIIVDDDPGRLLDRLAAWTPVTVGKWLDRADR